MYIFQNSEGWSRGAVIRSLRLTLRKFTSERIASYNSPAA